MDCSNLSMLNCEDFTKELASKKPVPGGGGASALVGAIGVALASMVGVYTIGKEKYKDVEGEIIALTGEAESIRTRLLELIDEDAKAFEPLSEAYKLKKDDPDREEILEKATVNALKAPFEIVKEVAKALDIIRIMQLKGSKMLLSDAGCAAAMCEASIESAAMNVYINTKSLKDREKAVAINNEINSIKEKYIPLAKTIIEEVNAELI